MLMHNDISPLISSGPKYTYTVRAMAEKRHCEYSPGRCTYEIVNAGAVATVRVGDRVVQQFSRCHSEQAAHRVAQTFIRLVQNRMAPRVVAR
jgi:uncharacterized ParB-like nuclease family protein